MYFFKKEGFVTYQHVSLECHFSMQYSLIKSHLSGKLYLDTPNCKWDLGVYSALLFIALERMQLM